MLNRAAPRPKLRGGILAAKHFPARSLASSSLQAAQLRGAPLDVHPEVQDALHSGKAVVALESTIITHGMPYPTNLTTARSVESIVRSTGAIPATIGLIAGRVKVGLEPSELERLADIENNKGVVKLSRRDIGPAIASRRDGGTTCSATLIFAALAGIKVFATGGLGGVHRGGESSMDVSADLHELTRCPVGLVSAGVKSILDIGRTLEYLETLGVPVITYGETDEFPAFYTRRSGHKSPWRLDDPQTAARVLRTHWQLNMTNGALFGVPIPESYEAVGATLQASVEQAVREAEENGVSKRGKEATPWLLKRVGELTSGKSLQSNVALIENTALIGGRIAVAYAELQRGQSTTSATRTDRSDVPLPIRFPPAEAVPAISEDVPAKLVSIGSTNVDITAQAAPETASDTILGQHSTLPGAVTLSLGGVSRNIAEAAHRVLSPTNDATQVASGDVLLVSALARDAFGRLLVEETARMGMRTDGLLEAAAADGARTAVCNMVLDGQGGLMGGIADMDVMRLLEKDKIIALLKKHQPNIVALDANLPSETQSSLVQWCADSGASVFFEPTSIIKSGRILSAIASILAVDQSGRSPIAFASPNLRELEHMYEQAQAEPLSLTSHPTWWSTVDRFGLGSAWRMDLDQLARRPACDADPSKGTLAFLLERGIAQMAVNLLPFFGHLVIKCGELGVVVAMRLSGPQAQAASGWARELRSNPRERFVLARGDGEIVVLKHFPALSVDPGTIVNVTGAGDSLVGAILAGLVRNPVSFEEPRSLDVLINTAQRAAVMTLQSPLAVSPLLSSLTV